MRLYLFKRIVLLLVTLFGVIVLNFALIQLLPGGPVEKVYGELFFASEGEMHSTPRGKGLIDDSEFISALQKRFEFEKPLWQRFWNESLRLLSFQFGYSYFHQESVSQLILEKIPVSLSLGFLAFLLSYLFCIPLGMLRAFKNGSLFDSVTGVLSLLGYALPSFALGVLLLVFFAGGSFWHLFPLRGLVSENFSYLGFWGKVKDYLHHLFLPAICVTASNLAFMSSLTKNSMLEHWKEDYVRTARAKGLTEFKIMTKHVLRNAAIPLVTGFGAQFFTLFLTSSILIESLFSLDGMGLLSYESILHRDYPVVMANLYLFSLFYLMGNLLSDLLYLWIDPRVRLDRKAWET